MTTPRAATVLAVATAVIGSLLLSAPPVREPGPPAATVAQPAAPPPPPPVVLTPAEVEATVIPAIVTLVADSGLVETAGTGIVLTPDGVVLTNHHVIDGALDISAVSLGNGAEYVADVLGYDSSRDVAVLRLQGAGDLPVATLAKDTTIGIGDPVTAVGNAEGGGVPVAARGFVTDVGQTITARSSTDGSRNRLNGLIQIDAAVRPGDSGGPLVDATAAVIGVNTAGNADSDPAKPAPTQPRSYAVPIDTAMTIVDQVRAGTTSATVHIGDTPLLGISVTDDDRGAEVLWVSIGTPADDAGIEIGDVVTEFDGTPIRSSDDLSERMIARHPGDEVALRWFDQTGRQRSTTIVLEKGPPR
ncbi:trypsin-like peptidase domain-containing protein [Rhodococcus opacus]|uniref:Trypsin-like peptidase domain-containing protein n=1 Tax=Rhodococcus opacus TaxID=37919 RepID=A0AAX3YI69_RHOOP|nr:trypsin-like peptidase domain-containing protein [Rhodococcus opacus]MCZ4584058.1 trypsin-like peptidase domain-containing protein [Rhodococcus opacus]WLF47813.1 trypsin-like peptidase domain-containing protein [Rhodococcus opacus]